MKKVLIALMVIIVLLSSVAEVLDAKADREYLPDDLYARVAIVSGFEFHNDLVFFTDVTGHVWECYEIEDWQLGDVACLIIWNAETREVSDDEIVWFTYNGRVSDMTKILEGIVWCR